MSLTYLEDLDRKRSRLGCVVLIVAAFALVGAAIWFFVSRSESEPVETPEEFVAALEERVRATDEAPLAPAPAPEAPAAPPARRASPRPPPQPEAAPPQARGPERGAELLAEAKAARADDNLLRARELGWKILDESRDVNVRAATEQLLGEVNIELVMTPRAMPEKIEYVVQSGDTLGAIARRFVPAPGHTGFLDLLHYSNRLRGPRDRPTLRVGDRIRIFNADMSIKVSKSRNDLVLYMNGKFFKRYPVGTGEFGSTPVGEFIIDPRGILREPAWPCRDTGRLIPYGSPDNPLGTRWIGFDIPGYGIHGTTQPETIGYQLSDGCIRMHNEDVEELFMLVRGNMPVTIFE